MNPLYFLHIPKTAGTALTQLLDNHFAAREILAPQTYRQLLPTQPRHLARYRLFRGHFGWAFLRLLPPETRLLTMLRHPLERTISHYHHLCVDRVANNWVGREFRYRGTLDEYLESEERRLFANPMVRHLGADLDVLAESAGHREEFYFDDHLARHYPADEAMLARARVNLQRCLLVGIQEQSTVTARLLCRLLGWPVVPLPRANVLPGRPPAASFSAATRQRILTLNQLDLRLYEHGLELFRRQAAEHGEEV
jgi:hypothetical protein